LTWNYDIINWTDYDVETYEKVKRATKDRKECKPQSSTLLHKMTNKQMTDAWEGDVAKNTKVDKQQ